VRAALTAASAFLLERIMEDPIRSAESIERILEESAGWDATGQPAAYAAIKLIAQEIRQYVLECNLPGRGYVEEKLASLSFHVGALYGIGEDNGHEAQEHRVWALGALGSIQGHLGRASEADESA